MADFDARARRGSHRARRNRLALLLVPLAVLLVGAIAFAGVLLARGNDNDEVAANPSPSAGASTSAAASGTPTAAPSPSSAVATPSTPTSKPAATSPTAEPSTTAASPSLSPTIDGTPVQEPQAGLKESTRIVVLNQTRVSGLANRVSNGLRDAGWTVVSLGNFRGAVPETTVYYPPGQEDAAAAVAADVPGGDRIRPRFGNLSGSSLTVIVTSATS